MKTLENIVSSLSRAKKALVIGTLAAVIGGSMALAACDGIPIEVIQTYMPTAAATTPAGKDTPEPEVTYTLAAPATEAPTLEPTYTATTEPTATETSVPSIVVPDLNPYLSGVGEHGAMVCLSPLDSASLDQLVLKANISQEGEILDRNISAENIEGNGSCFEAIDAKYKIGIPVSVEINVTSTERQVENGTQISDVGDFDWFPFLSWIYGDSPLNTKPSRIVFPNPTHPDAYDLQPSNTNFPDALNHPVYSPCDGKIIRYEYVDLGENNQFHNLLLYCENTGYVMQLGHMESILNDGEFVIGNKTIPIKVGEEIGLLVKDPVVGYIHNHTKLMRPLDLSKLNTTCNANNIEKNTCSQIIDLFNPILTTNQGNSPIYGLWIPQSLPSSTQEYILSGTIQPEY